MPLRPRIALLSLILLAATAPAAFAQRDVGPDPNRDPRLGVYVRDSAVAGEKLALAERMERLKEWDKSADVYQEIVEKYADRVVPSGAGANNAAAAAGAVPQRYKSVTLAVQERLGKWPEEGLATYRARYETPARSLLEAAGLDDAAALSRVVQTYFPTVAAKEAAMRLVELYIETGEFAAAAWTGQRLLAHHPDLGADRPRLLFRTALAQHLAGDVTDAKANLEQLKAQHADATGTVRGQEVVLAAELEKMLAAPAAVAHGASSDSWPILGGNPTRGRIPAAAARPGTKLVDIPLARARPRPIASPELRGRIDTLEKNRRESGLSLGIVPVVDRGEIFYQDGSRLYAKGMESGFTLPGWTTTYSDETGSGGLAPRQRYANPGVALTASGQLTATVTDSSVLAVLGGSRGAVVMNEIGIPVAPGDGGQLVCLDRATGARRWSVAPRHFPDALANLRELELGGSPLVVGDNVYLAARGGKPMQFEDSYVLCFDLADGKLRWACYLASGNARNFNHGGMMALGESDLSHLAYAGGRVYAVTNLGAVAAIDAYSGTITWLALYPRPPQINNGFGMHFGGGRGVGGDARKPWAQNPAIVKDGRLFCLPTDSQHLLIYDAASGDEVKRLKMSDFDDADTIIGVTPDRLVLTSNNEVFCIDWPKYDAQRPHDSLHWKSILSGPDTEEANRDTVRGRGFVTTDSVFVPTKWNLRRLSLENGRAEQTYPASGTWPPGEGPGNVLVTGDQIVVAGADAITVYSDLALARAKLDRAIAAAPNDPLPRLMYAETLFAAGQTDAAIEKLDAAIGLLGGLKSMRPGTERDRAFARSLAFAERIASPKEGPSDPVQAASLFDRAAAAAFAPPQQVAYRLSRARFARAQRDFLLEVRLYQEILGNPAWRAVVVPAEDGSGTIPAAVFAERAIDERVRDMPAAYRPFEQAAAEKLAIARQANDPAQMLAVAQVYPNAKVAPEAMLAAADAFEAAGKHRPATQVLNQAYRKYHEQADKARIIEAQARNYLKLPGGVDVAIGRLTEGAQLTAGAALRQPLVLPDGDTIENVSFGAAAEILQRYSARLAVAALPEFNIPPWQPGKRSKAFVPETPQSIIHDVDRLLVPPRELRDSGGMRHDRIVTWSRGGGGGGAGGAGGGGNGSGGIAVFPVGSNQPLGTNATLNREPAGMAWSGDDLLVWTSDRLVLLKGDELATGWDVNVRGLPQVEIVDAADAVSRVDEIHPLRGGVQVGPGLVFVDNQLVQVGAVGQRVRGAVNIVQAERIRLQQQQQQQAERIEHVRPLGDRVIFATSSGRIAAIDLANGQLLWQTRTADASLEQLVANNDFLAARFVDEGGGAQLVALETFGGQIVLRTTFSNETAPINVQLAPDGTLLYVRPDRICGKDLYEPGPALKFGDGPIADGNRVFDGAGGHGQLVVAEGRIYALADSGQFIRVLSLYDGREIGNRLSTGSTNWDVHMRVVGPRLYVFNSRTVTSYHVHRDNESWTGLVDSFQVPTIRDAFIGKQHVVLLDQPTPPGAQPSGDVAPRFRLLAYGRYPTAPDRQDESGKFDQSVDVMHPVGIHADQWQPVDGGFYYHSVDRKAHFLKGSAGEQE